MNKTMIIGFLTVVGLLSIVVTGVPSFGTYNCSTSTYTIVNNGLTNNAGRYGIAASTNASTFYEFKLNFNTSSSLLAGGAVFNPYFTSYTGETYAIFDLSTNTSTTPVATANGSTCSQTLADFADEATRVYDLSRAPGIPAYRNDLLDEAATNLVNTNGTLSVSPSFNTASGTTTVSYVAGTLTLVNPGAIIQVFLNTNSGNLSRAARELGVYYSPLKQQMGFVFASRVIACGNGVLDSLNETCDDNNTVSGDGCSANCQIESGYNCSQTIFAETTVCVRTTPSNSSSSPTNATSPSGSPRSSATAANSSSSTNPSSSSSSSNSSNSNSISLSMTPTRVNPITQSNSNSISISASTSSSLVRQTATSSISTSASNSMVPTYTSNPSASNSPEAASAVGVASASEVAGGNVGGTGGSSTLKTWMKFIF